MSVIAQAGYTREDQPESQRRPYFLYADEFASFSTDATLGMLSELRKYRLGLTLSAQHCSQLSTRMLDAVLGNTGTQIVFRLGATDAGLLGRQLGGIDPADIIGLPNYRNFTRLMVEGERTRAFSAVTRPSVRRTSEPARDIQRNSNANHGRD